MEIIQRTPKPQKAWIREEKGLSGLVQLMIVKCHQLGLLWLLLGTSCPLVCQAVRGTASSVPCSPEAPPAQAEVQGLGAGV